MKALQQQPKIAAAVTFAIGVALAGVAAWLQSEHDAALAGARFDALVARTAAQVETRLKTYEYALRGARGSAISTRLDQLSRERFHD